MSNENKKSSIMSIDDAIRFAIACHQAGKLSDAERAYSAILFRYPNHPEANYRLGLLATEISKYEAAIPLLERAVSLRPLQEEYRKTYEYALEKLDLVKRQNENISSFMQISGNNSSTNELRAPIIKKDSFKMKTDKQLLKILVNEYQNGNFEILNQKTYEYIDKYQLDPKGWMLHGAVLQQVGLSNDAYVAYKKSLALDPHDVDTLSNMAGLLGSEERFDEAFHFSKRALERDPDHVNSLVNAGFAATGLYQLKEAVAYLEKALVKEPNNPNALFNLGCAYKKYANYEKALKCFDTIIQLETNLASALNQKAIVLSELNYSDLSILENRKAIQLLMKEKNKKNYLNDLTKNPMPVQEAGETLLSLDQFLKSINAPYFIAFGTLLGIYRGGDLLPFDKDVDIGMNWDVDRDWLIDQIQSSNDWTIEGDKYLSPQDKLWNIFVVNKNTNIGVDFFFFKPEENKLVSRVNIGKASIEWIFSEILSGTIGYREATLSCPKNPELFLKEIYGENWRIPNPYFDSLISGLNLSRASFGTSKAVGYTRLYHYISKNSWKKALGYCNQLMSYGDDDWLKEVINWLEEKLRLEIKNVG